MFGQIGKDDHHGSGIDLVDTAGRDDIGALLSASEAEG
jgi:hypothetical protein